MKMKINWEKIFLILTILSAVLMIGFFISAIWVNSEILSDKLAITGVVTMFIAAVSAIVWSMIYFGV